ncbi:hypothetical protein D3C72_1795230 [compost metagenome]
MQGDGVAEERDRQKRADEGGEREVGAGSRRAEVAQAEHEEDEADADAEKADEGGAGDEAGGRQRGAERQGKHKVRGAGRQTLDHGDLDRIGGGQFSRQIVVDAPRKAGARDQQAAAIEAQPRTIP